MRELIKTGGNKIHPVRKLHVNTRPRYCICYKKAWHLRQM